MFKFLFLSMLAFSINAQTISVGSVSAISHYLHKLNSKGSVSDFTPHGTQPGLARDMLDASICADCHGNSAFGTVISDVNYMPYATWAGSMMANATRDPLFWAAVDIANQDVPGVGDFCIRCHTPLGFYNGHTKDGTGDMDYANGCKLASTVSSTENKLNDYQGVVCHFCHRLDANGPSNEAFINNNANAWLDDGDCTFTGSGPCRKGPYKDYSTNPNVNAPPHAWEYSSFISTSEVCGTCHNVSSPEILTNGVLTIARTLIDENGTDLGIAMPIERTFAEWNNSLFADLIYTDGFGGESITEVPNIKKGETCQGCHMPNSNDSNTRACAFPANGTRTGNLKKHEFAGGNSWMPQVLKSTYGTSLDELGIFSRSDAYDRTTNYALDMLQTKSALIDTTLVSASVSSIQIKVKVTNLTGHKLPTGYPEGRRMWIHLQVRDDANTLIYESGAYDLATAVLTEDSDSKIYESLQGIWDAASQRCKTEQAGQKIFHFALNNCIAKDNRIPPLGFRGGQNVEIKPYAINYPNRPAHTNQLVNFDETIYTIAIPNVTAITVMPLKVTATLKYQTSSKEYIDFLDAQSTTASENTLCNRTQSDGPANQSRGAYMKTLWQNNGKSAPVDMVSSVLIIN